MIGDPVVTVTPTIQSGTVVRWRHSANGAAVLSASRDGVMIHGDVFLHDIPQRWLEIANQVHAELKRDRDVDLRFLATHRSRGFGCPLEPVPEATP